MSRRACGKTFRLAFVRNKINRSFHSPALKAALLAEINSASEDAAAIVEMVEKMRPISTPPIQAVAPRQKLEVAPAPQPGPAPRPRPVPAPADGNSEDTPVEVLDSEEEIVNEMNLTSRREQRVRRQLRVWRDRQSSSSDLCHDLK